MLDKHISGFICKYHFNVKSVFKSRCLHTFFKAFTLAEVLITLGIIGVVAAITIPTLTNSINDMQYKAAYKKAYSTLSQTWLKAYSDGNLTDRLVALDNVTDMANFAVFKTYLKITKDCTSGIITDCWASGESYYGAPKNDASTFIDIAGMSWASCSSATQKCGGEDLLVDTNGPNGPNKFGQDRFAFTPTTKDGLNYGGSLIRISVHGDCLNTTDCPTYANVCPSVVTHPCYFMSWALGGD